MHMDVMHTMDEEFCYAELRILDTDQEGVRDQNPTVKIQRLSDGYWADFSVMRFKDPDDPLDPIVDFDTLMDQVHAARATGF